jgi:tetratricopeptide (TPR) repeat protein
LLFASALSGWGGLAFPLSGCLGRPTVVRVVDGRPIEGRFINSHTYSLYARGAYHEQRGELEAANAAFSAAAERDPDSAAIWTRLGAVACASGSAEHTRAFGRAEAIDPEHAPLWRERAACALRAGDPKTAIALAELALRFEPLDGATSLVLASALEKSGRAEDALRIVRGLTTLQPSSRAAWTRLAEIAERHDRPADALSAARALAPAARHPASRAREQAALDLALARGDLPAARALAIAAGMRADALAVRAAKLGLPELAREQARLVLDADRSSSEAWIAALVAADLSGDFAGFTQALDALDPDAAAPGPEAARLMADLLARRVGADAARAWSSAYGPLPASGEASPSAAR